MKPLSWDVQKRLVLREMKRKLSETLDVRRVIKLNGFTFIITTGAPEGDTVYNWDTLREIYRYYPYAVYQDGTPLEDIRRMYA